MSDETANSVREILQKFDSSLEPFLEVSVTDALRGARPEDVSSQERAHWWAESAAMSFHRRPDRERSVWGTACGPIMSATRQDGSPFYSPDIREADAETIEYWGKRSLEAKHPILRARYSDLVWDFSRVIAKQRPDISFARKAIDAYIEATRLTYKQDIQAIHYAERALQLATSIADKGRIQNVVDAIFELYDRVARPEHAGSWPFLFDSLLNNNITLTEEQRKRVMNSLEEMLRRSADQTNPKEFNPWGAQAAAERLAQEYRRAGAQNEAHRVLRAYGIAFERLAKNAVPTLVLGWLQPVYETYSNAGMTEDAKRVQLLCEEAGKHAHEDMKTISTQLEIPAHEMESYLESISADSLELTYGRIAAQFIPRAEAARDFLKEMTQKAPLVSMIGVHRIADGHIAAQAGSVDADPDGRLIMHLAESIELESMFLSPALDKARERYGPTSQAVCTLLRRSPVFTDESEGLLTEGIEAYFQGDLVKAIHVLIPQVEAAMRALLGLLGIPTSKPMRSAKGVMQAKNLNDALGDPNVKEILGENVILYLQTFLNDPRGQNLRNRISHGLTAKRYLAKQLADRLFHVLLVLSLVRKQNDS